MHRTLAFSITIFNMIMLLFYIFSEGLYSTLYIAYVIIMHSTLYILFTKQKFKYWWLLLIVGILITLCSIFLYVLYMRVRQIGH